MKTTVVARSREEAELIIKNKIIFHSIREQPNSYSQKEDFILKNIMDIFNI